jgi:DMSO/TMAO reductase YedYZ molybdopterin-dependent catalytic subunit
MLDRRDLLLSLGRLGVLGAVLPAGGVAALLAQARRDETWGKEQLIARAVLPPDYETPVSLLDSWITPNEHFYVRSHMPVPAALDPATWTLQIEGEVATPLTLSVDEIRRMPSTTVTMTLECAGNGRAFFEPSVAGIQWQKGAVGTARWTGVRLADVLKRAGIKPSGAFVVMNGADRGPGTMPDFVRQLPLAKAMHADTLIAYEMNGVPIPPVHGFPLRAIVPGWEGAYAIKWLTNLRVIDKEFDGFWVATGYRYPTKRVKPGEAVAPADTAPLTGLVVKSLITRPLDGATVQPGKIVVAGFAWAGEDDVERVEVSADHGGTWQRAELVGERAPYAWRRFEATLHATKAESYLIMSRATDTKGRSQPDVAHWNPSGYLWNAPDRVRIEVALTEVRATDPVPAPMPSHAAQETTAGESVFQRACLSCHGSDLVEQQRLTPAGWTREIDKMIRWGAQVPDTDKDALVRFLTARYGSVR